MAVSRRSLTTLARRFLIWALVRTAPSLSFLIHVSNDSRHVGKGQTVSGTSVNAKNQVENQHTGSADHLELGMRK